MSDFAKLLGNLKNTAKKASASSSKRSRLDEDPENKNDHHDNYDKHGRVSKKSKVQLVEKQITAMPKDVNQLSIKLSFLGIGAQKAGTSWLHQMLGFHENLSLPKQKEVHFWDWNRRKGLRWYSNQFPQQGGKYFLHGEITPCYAVLEEKHICEIKKLFPDVKLIFIARDLVERAWSALLMELRNAVNGLDAGVFAKNDDRIATRELEKIERESNPNKYNDSYFMDRLIHSTHNSRSDYAKSLRLWLKYFPKDQLLILDYNDVSKRPRDLLGKVCQHIGVDGEKYFESLKDDKLSERINAAGGKTRYDIRPSLRTKMISHLKPFAQNFNELLSELDYKWRLCDYSNIEK